MSPIQSFLTRPATGALGEYFGDRQKTVTFGHEAGTQEYAIQMLEVLSGY